MSFTDTAARLAGFAAAVLGWRPDTCGRATPAELTQVVAALIGDRSDPPDRATIARLRKAFPDG